MKLSWLKPSSVAIASVQIPVILGLIILLEILIYQLLNVFGFQIAPFGVFYLLMVLLIFIHLLGIPIAATVGVILSVISLFAEKKRTIAIPGFLLNGGILLFLSILFFGQ
jgi:hypothetical protein